MAVRTNLDMDVLRTFVLGFELGSFARAADRLGRSQSAVSAQLHKLEEQIGTPLVQKSGRSLALTTAGESLLSYAKRLLELNDEAVETIRGADLEGWVRLGLPQDFADTFLPSVLGRFARAHPKVRVEVQVDASARLIEKTLRGDLDVALAWGNSSGTPYAERVANLAIAWVGLPDSGNIRDCGGSTGADPLPLVAFEPPCSFRSAGIAALDEAGIAWRLVFTSPSLSGLWAAAEAGLGITVRTTIAMPRSLAVLDPLATGLPVLPPIPLSLHRKDQEANAVVRRLTEIVLDTVLEEINAA
ncbi:LysR substrate-binding domain-containing protein [Paraburkholderia sp. SARCC-3016]|uniref:LysR substrate-binding domain-containing protein n=1 Tax=Paraburkholderia sp. SARCC-3016 TaxID=3058611 RepID=UPI0028067726|nr:LysR substrate-binding domain-containing protein [Paraburkholderia sp. SARCC-3016]MDQ7977940.1 LysR substrate-binding domain-containing protein [Paraburkholderia sp. SARCC-3016]